MLPRSVRVDPARPLSQVVGLLESLSPVLTGEACCSGRDGADDTSGGEEAAPWEPPSHDASMFDIIGRGSGKARPPTVGVDIPVRTLSQALWVDVGRYAVQWVIMLSLGALYLVLQYFLAVPGCPTGYIGEGEG